MFFSIALFLNCVQGSQGGIPGASLSTLTNSPLTVGLRRELAGVRYSRNGPKPNISAVIAEDCSCVWVAASSSTFQVSQQGWARFLLPEGTTRGGELIRFFYVPQQDAVNAFTLSQSKLAIPLMEELKAIELTDRRVCDVVAPLDINRIVVRNSEGPSFEQKHTYVAAGLIDVTKRGKWPNKADAIRIPVRMRGERIGVQRISNRVLMAEAREGEVYAYSYDFRLNRMDLLSRGSFNPPLVRNGKPVVPRLYDFKTKIAFYDFASIEDRKARIWTEYDGQAGRWRRLSIPPGDPGAVFYARRKLYAQSWESETVCALFEAGADRKSWERIGPYMVHARSVSDKYWLVQKFPDGEVLLATFPG